MINDVWNKCHAMNVRAILAVECFRSLHPAEGESVDSVEYIKKLLAMTSTSRDTRNQIPCRPALW